MPIDWQARRTKQHLERKWGVQFPNTGFCNFVKFSIVRHVDLEWTELPSRWIEQAALFVSWFEMVGFNRHGNSTLGSVVASLEADSQLGSFRAEGGFSRTSIRDLIPTAKVDPGDWVESGIGRLLHFQAVPMRLETRYQVEHMSLAVLRVPLNAPFDRKRVAPLCGMIVRSKEIDICWIYVAPHSHDHPFFQVSWFSESIAGAVVQLRYSRHGAYCRCGGAGNAANVASTSRRSSRIGHRSSGADNVSPDCRFSFGSRSSL